MNTTKLLLASSIAALIVPLQGCGDDTATGDADTGTGTGTGGTTGTVTVGPTTGSGPTTGGTSTSGMTTDSTTNGSADSTTGGTTDPTTGGTTDTAGGTDTGGLCEDYRRPDHVASDQAEVAGGLSVAYLTREAAEKTDMMALWPHESNSPTHLVSCVEGGREIIDGGSKYNPSVQAIDLSDGSVATILRGMDRCDGVRSTPWGTILATEESVDGAGYEILDPLADEEFTITDRGAAGAAATIVDESDNDATAMVVKRTALPTMAWEGLAVLDSGVVIGGDELRPGSYEDDAGSPDTDGGSIFKFVPDTLHGGGAIIDLASSPLVSGTTHAMQVSCRDNSQQVGQGCEVGNAAWIAVDAADARVEADTLGATGYYRPEDLHVDPAFQGDGVRFCWTNTGNEGASNFGEVVCGVDSDPTSALADTRSVVVNRFIEGDEDFNAFDNIAFQPDTGILYVIEDHTNGDVFACLPDGDDRDLKSDGCVRMLSVVDESAEPTGFVFSPDGTTAWVSVQHSDDCNMPMVDDYDTDDLLEITGFSAPSSAAIASFGSDRYQDLLADVADLFGTGMPLADSAAGTSTHRVDNTLPGNPSNYPSQGVTSFGDGAADQVTLAGGLTATYLTRIAANHTDMMELYPVASPTHLITCVEGSREIVDGDSKYNPSVQAIDLSDGSVQTVLRGMDRCDGIRTTAWGTVVATEETVDGSIYEILDPLDGETYTITDRGSPGVLATIVDGGNAAAADSVVKRVSLPTIAWEGLTVLDNGVVIGGDELRPGSYEVNGSMDVDGGALFKFVPDTFHGGGTITDLTDSPLVGGTAHALQVSCRDNTQQFGQGCEIGNGAWIEIDPDIARQDANAGGATGYYRPEDLHTDPTYAGPGVRFCWTNTGNEGASNFGEVICGIDTMPATAADDMRTVVVNRFIEGDEAFDAFDNLAFQPESGSLYVIEDHRNGDVFACLPDGDDRDIKSDYCVRILSIVDTSAEPTGFVFSPDGTTAYVSIQHSASSASELQWDDYDTDDVLLISGFADPSGLTPTTFGAETEQALVDDVADLFGFGTPLRASATQP